MHNMGDLIPYETIELPQTGSWPKSHHKFDSESVWAIQAALAAKRPLLVRGKPGTGKSQLARAAAVALGRMFVSEVMHARSEPHDLLWYFDAVGRLGEAQTLSGVSNRDEINKRLHYDKFMSPGALWWVYDYETALSQYNSSLYKVRQPEVPDGWTCEKGSVLLIDEIDKADADLPNGLLETLGNGAFPVPYVNQTVGLTKGVKTPLVVITTNEERELPAAFLRRCLVLQIKLPVEETEFLELMVERGKVHFDGACSEAIMREAAEQLYADRMEALKQGMPEPGPAEYLDLLRAITEISSDEKEQRKVLKAIQHFTFKKYPVEEG